MTTSNHVSRSLSLLGLFPLLAATATAQTAPPDAQLSLPGSNRPSRASVPAASTSGGGALVLDGSGAQFLGSATETLFCPDSLNDQATGDCLMASSEATLGMLYPLSEKLFVDELTGRVGIGSTSPQAPLHAFADAANAGVARFDNAHAAGFSGVYFDENGENKGWAGYVNSGSFFGAPGTMQIAASRSDLVFSTNDAGFFEEKMRVQIDGDVGIGTSSPQALLHVDGRVRMGSETGTSQSPQNGFAFTYGGLVTRRVYSSSNAAGQIVARDDTLRLERDGTAGGLIMIWGPTSNAILNCNGYAVTAAGVVLPIRQTGINQFGGGTRQIALDADQVVSVHATFGNFHNGQHTTTVTLNRSLPTSSVWVGTVTSTFDQ